MCTVSLPAQRGMSRAVASLTCSLRVGGSNSSGPADHRRPGPFSTSWRSFWRRVVTEHRSAPAALWGTANGAVFARAVATAASNGPARAAGDAPDGPRVCILGGGFGGLYTAVKLESLFWPRGTKPRVTLVDQSDRFTFKPLLYELLTGAATSDEVAPPFAQLLAPYPVTLVRGRVASVTPEEASTEGGSEGGGTVVLESGEAVAYDWLVLALGAETNTFGIPGVKEHALAFSTYDDAAKLLERLEAVEARGGFPEVVVVGGGYAGVEMAAAVADRLRGRGRIQLVTSGGDILPGAPEGQRDAARRALQDDGVSLVTGARVQEVKLAAAGQTERAAAEKDSESSSSSAKRLVYVKNPGGQTEIFEADVVVWAAGQAPVPRLEGPRLSLPFPTDASGATETDPMLRVLRNKRVFALGDVAVGGGPYKNGAQQAQERMPATAQVAFQQADYVAWNIWASINNKPLLKFTYQHLGDMMSLGATKGAVSLPIPVPPPLSAAVQSGPLGELLRVAGVKVSTTYAGASDGVTVEGPLGAALRRAAYLYRQPTDQQRLRVAASWAGEAGKWGVELARQVLAGPVVGSKKSD